MPSSAEPGWRRGTTGGVSALLVFAALACGLDEPPPTTVGLADSADQIAYGVIHYVTVDGLRRARLEADTAYFYQGPQTADLRQLRVTFYSSQGAETSTLTAESGTYYWRTGNMEARGNVVGLTPDGRRLRTSVLEFDSSTDRIVGSEPFTYTEPNRELSGAAFNSDPDFRDIVATQPRGRVGRIDVDRDR